MSANQMPEPSEPSRLVAKLGSACSHRSREVTRLRKLVAQLREQVATCWEGWADSYQRLAAAELCTATAQQELLEAQARLEQFRCENGQLSDRVRELTELNRVLQAIGQQNLEPPPAVGEVRPPMPVHPHPGSAGRVLGYGGLDIMDAEWDTETEGAQLTDKEGPADGRWFGVGFDPDTQQIVSAVARTDVGVRDVLSSAGMRKQVLVYAYRDATARDMARKLRHDLSERGLRGEGIRQALAALAQWTGQEVE